MSNSKFDTTTEESMARLSQIATLLECPVAVFFDPAELNQTREIAEILRLWKSLKTKEQRQLALDYIKAIASGFGAKITPRED